MLRNTVYMEYVILLVHSILFFFLFFGVIFCSLSIHIYIYLYFVFYCNYIYIYNRCIISLRINIHIYSEKLLISYFSFPLNCAFVLHANECDSNVISGSRRGTQSKDVYL